MHKWAANTRSKILGLKLIEGRIEPHDRIDLAETGLIAELHDRDEYSNCDGERRRNGQDFLNHVEGHELPPSNITVLVP